MIWQTHQTREHDVTEFALIRAGLLDLLSHENENVGREHAFWNVVSQASKVLAEIAKRVNNADGEGR